MRLKVRAAGCALAFLVSAVVQAHDGPPFPIVSDQGVGAYLISIWTDPDTTDDGAPGGQFWVRLEAAAEGKHIPEGTRATVSITALSKPGRQLSAAAAPVRGDVTNQFAAVLMDHEGRFAVRVNVEGPLGPAVVESAVDATYDLRPPPGMLFLYLAPFVVVAVLWVHLLIRRRGARAAASGHDHRT